MKRLYILLYFTLSVSSFLMAYDYQTVYSQRTALFSDSYGNIKSMRIDSVQFSQDSILYPIKNIQKLGSNCYTPYGASWLGAKIIVKPTWNYFFNENNDTIRIKTDAKLNETWKVFGKEDVWVSGTVIKVELLTFMGLTDSVKTIEFNMTIATSATVSSKSIAKFVADFDGKIIQISKHYGLIKTYNFNVFPYFSDTQETYMGTWQQFNLVGLTNPKAGVQNLTSFDIFDFQVGDELHTIEKNIPALGGVPPGFLSERDQIEKYIKRLDFQDSIKYTVEVSLRTITHVSGIEYLIKNLHYTTTQIVMPNHDFDILPEVPLINTYSANKYSMYYDGVTTTKREPDIFNEIHRTADSCWSLILADGCLPTFSYVKGLGGPYYSCSGIMGDSQDNSLVYYKKGLSTWGTPLIITGTNQPKAMSEIEIYLNPTTDKLTINHELPPGESTFELLDLQGKVVRKLIIRDNENQLSLAEFSKGLYLYRLINNGKLLKAGKIVKM